MSKLTILHNPRCSKSRQTLQLLQQQGVEPTVVEYLKTPPSVAELSRLMQELNITDVREMMRTKEDEYSQLNLAQPELSTDELLTTLSLNPKLIERPIVSNGKTARIGRPPENVLELL